MLQRYKLRLADGTSLVVDRDGLSTWALDQKAMVQTVGSHEWFTLRDFVAADRLAAAREARQESKAPAVVALPLVPPPAAEAAKVSVAMATADAVGPVPQADEEVPWADLAEDSPPAPSPLAALAAEAPASSAPELDIPEAAVAADEAVVPSEEPPFVDEQLAAVPLASDESLVAAPEPLAEPLEWSSEACEVPALGEPANLQALAEDVAPSSAAEIAPPIPVEEIAIIPFKPVDDAPRVVAATQADDFDDVALEPPPRNVADERLLKVLFAYADLVTRVFRALARAASALEKLRRRARIRNRNPGVLTRTRHRAAAWKHALRQWLGSIRLRGEPSPVVVALAPVVAIPAERVAREPVTNPPTVQDMPILRFAVTDDSQPREDVYDGPELDGGDSATRLAWLWIRRLAVFGILVASGILGAATSETWIPFALEGGRRAVVEVEAYRQSREEARQLEKVQRVASQLPYLSSETIRRVLATRPASALEAPEIFRLAYEAEDAGRSSLSALEAQELSALRGRLIATLGALEQERVREYDRARGHRVTFTFENASLAEYFTRGWHALTPPSQERLHFLSGKAIAAGLARSARL